VDAALASRVLSWRPTVTLAEGLALTAEWFATAEDRGEA
jgi:nucleoside-diphosphate-sugar epimerase